MELSAAVLATRLDKITREELSLPVDQSFFWTDSTCVLRYIENDTKRFQTFVANRVAAIRDSSSPSQWNYVDTQSNPADDASRGVPADAMQRSINGPDFLSQAMENWPERPADMGDIPSDDLEIKKDAKVYATERNTSNPILTAFERVSSWNNLKKIMAWILRYKTNLRKRAKNCNGKDTPPKKQDDTKALKMISVQEMNEAER
jgi:hypothetical protein